MRTACLIASKRFLWVRWIGNLRSRHERARSVPHALQAMLQRYPARRAPLFTLQFISGLAKLVLGFEHRLGAADRAGVCIGNSDTRRHQRSTLAEIRRHSTDTVPRRDHASRRR